MKKRILDWLSTPYYFNPSVIFKLKVSFYLGISVFVFLYVFKPFNLTSLGDTVLHYTAAIGLFSFVGSFFMLLFPPLLFPKYFNEDNWTVGKNIILIFVGLLLIGISLWYCSVGYKKDKDLPVINLPLYLLYTFLVGAIPIFVSVYLNERNLKRNRRKKINAIKTFRERRILEKKKAFNTKINIYLDNKKEHINFDINDLVYITSQGNYASFFIKENDILKEKILRVTLTKIDKELEAYTKVIRCHKSFIVNTNFMADISGNARGYILISNLLSIEIPVSRSFSKQSLMSFLD